MTDAAATSAMRRVLVADIEARAIVLTPAGYINWRHYCKRLGMPQKCTDRMKIVFAECNRLCRKSGFATRTSNDTVDRLTGKLKADLRNRTLVLNDNGQIHSAYYLFLVGLKPPSGTRYKHVFDKFTELGRDAGIVPPLLKDKAALLRDELNKDLAAGCLRFSNRRLVNFTHYANRLGFKEHHIKDCKAVIDEFSALGERLGLIPTESRKEALFSLLRTDLTIGALMRDVTGKIDHKHYAEALGLVAMPSYLLEEVVTPFERDNPGIDYISIKFDEMAEWLERRYESRTLKIKLGRFTRREFADFFHLTHVRFEEDNPKLADVFKKLETRAQREGYQVDRRAMKLASRETRETTSVPAAMTMKRTWNSGTHRPNSTSTKLEALLTRDLEAGTLRVGNERKIDLQHYADQLGITRSAVGHYRDVLRKIEDMAGGRRSNAETKTDAMRLWISKHMGDGTLELTGYATISITQFCQAFSIPDSYCRELPEIVELLADANTEIARSGYLPKFVVDELAQLQDYLDGDPTINNDCLTVSRPAITDATGITIGSLRAKPYKDVITRWENGHLRRLRADRLVLFVGKLPRSLRQLSEIGYSKKFLRRVRESLVKAFEDLSNKRAVDTFNCAYDLLDYIARHFPDVRDRLCDDENFWRHENHRRWYLIAVSFKASLAGYVGNKLQLLNKALTAFARDQLVPHIPSLRREREGDSANRPSLAEALPIGDIERRPPARDVSTYMEFVDTVMSGSLLFQEMNNRPDDRGTFLASLQAQMRSDAAMSDDPRLAVLGILDLRLDSAVQIAEATIAEGIATFEYGRRLILETSKIGSLAELRSVVKAGFAHPDWKRWFPELHAERSLGSLLTFYINFAGGVVPASTGSNFLRQMNYRHGGAKEVQKFLIPHKSIVSSMMSQGVV